MQHPYVPYRIDQTKEEEKEDEKVDLEVGSDRNDQREMCYICHL